MPGFEADAGLWKADACIAAQIDVYQQEVAGWSASLSDVEKNAPIGDLPVLVLSRDPRQPRPSQLPAPLTEAQWQQANLIWDGLQQKLAQLSTHGRRIIVKGSGHYIQFDRPDLLDREVPIFIQQVRDGSTPLTDSRVPVE